MTMRLVSFEPRTGVAVLQNPESAQRMVLSNMTEKRLARFLSRSVAHESRCLEEGHTDKEPFSLTRVKRI